MSDLPPSRSNLSPELPPTLLGPVEPSAAPSLPPTLAASAAVPPEPLPIHVEVPGYEILGELGRGGMGVVYKARQVALKRLVALKMVLSGVHAGSMQRARFLAEAEAAARLQHPNIVQIYEISEHEGRPFFSMEFVDGPSLASVLHGTPQNPRQAAATIEVLALAMQTAHQAGIVHRDLKPANILLGVAGGGWWVEGGSVTRHPPPATLHAKITDFGLAKHLGEESHLSHTGDVMGTPSYMAPEQASGQVKEIGPAADVYALGAILYEMLTGRPPFKAETLMDTMMLVVSGEPVPPSHLRPNMPHDLETICLKCLEKDPGRRYTSGSALADDLRRFQEDRPILARPTSAGERLWRWCRRNRTVAALTATVALALLAGTVLSTYFGIEARSQARAAQESAANERQAKELAEDSKHKAEAAKHDLARLLYDARMQVAQRAWNDGDLNVLEELLARTQPSQTGEDHRNFEWHYLNRVAHAECFVLPPPQLGRPSGFVRAAFSRDGKEIVTARHDGGIAVWDGADGRPLRQLKAPTGKVFGAVLSPGGERLAFLEADGQALNGKVHIWDPVVGKELTVLAPSLKEIAVLAFRPDGWALAVAGDATIRLWNLKTGQEERTLSLPGTASVRALAFSTDGSRLAAADHAHAVHVWELATGKELHRFSDHPHDVVRLVFSHNGADLVSVERDGVLRVRALASGTVVQTIKGPHHEVTDLAFSPTAPLIACAERDGLKLWEVNGSESGDLFSIVRSLRELQFSPDGKRLLAIGADQVVRVWNVGAGQNPQTVATHQADAFGLAFRPHGSELATAGPQDEVAPKVPGLVQLWDANGNPGRSFDHPTRIHALAFRPNGRHLATGGADGLIYLWDADSGAKMRTLCGHTAAVHSVAFAPDGKRLASGGADGSVRVWDADTGQQLFSCAAHPVQVTQVVFGPAGRQLASCGDNGAVLLWNAADGTKVRTLKPPGSPVERLVFRPDGKRLAVAEDRTVRIWDMETGKELLAFAGHTQPVSGVCFNPDGTRLATCSKDGMVRLWNPLTGQEVLRLHTPNVEVTDLAFSPDGRRLASIDRFGKVRIWDATPKDESK